MNAESIQRALDLAKLAHAGQVRKPHGRPYYDHVFDVSLTAPKFLRLFVPELHISEWVRNEASVVGALHDVLEDTNVTEAELRGIFPASVVNAVRALTHAKGVSYEDYIEGIASVPNPVVRAVKMADILHNLGDHPPRRRVPLYAAALVRLSKEVLP